MPRAWHARLPKSTAAPLLRTAHLLCSVPDARAPPRHSRALRRTGDLQCALQKVQCILETLNSVEHHPRGCSTELDF